MKTKFIFRLLSMSFALVLLWSFNVSAANWGAETSASTFDAPSYYTNHTIDDDGGQDSINSYSSVSDNRGNAQADASIGLELQLKAEAYHTSGMTGASGQARVIQEYTYSGEATTDLRLAIELSGGVYNSGNSDAFIQIGVYAFKEEPFDYYPYIGTLYYEIGAQLMQGSDLYEEGASAFEQTYYEGEDILDINGFDFTVEPGETFYIMATLEATAVYNQSWADSFSTLDVYFYDDSNLSVGSEVPLPGALCLFLSGLGGITFLRRKESN